MFNNKKLASLRERNRILEDRNNELYQLTLEYGNDNRIALDKQKEELELKATRAAEKAEDELARLKSNQDVEIAKATKILTDEVAKLKLTSSTAEEKVKMYEKAFENLGFDVKDMKEILNKLVDGVVAKNQIQLVNAK